MASLMVSKDRESGLTSTPRMVRLAAPSMSLSTASDSRENTSREPSIPADSLIKLAPACPARTVVIPFSYPAWPSGSLESAMPAATPDGRSSQFTIWAAAAVITASSPDPPLIAPVRRSDTNGHMSNEQG